MSPSAVTGKKTSGRLEGIDVARAVAGIIMIQGHAYDGWASPAAKETAAYAFTRVLGSLPLPAFLVLAGAAVAVRTQAAAVRGESATKVRWRVARRGLEAMGWGYLVSAIYALMDGYAGLETLLRVDVLHVIGLSIAVLAALGIRPARGSRADAAPSPRRLANTAAILGVAVTGACPFVSGLGADVVGPVRFFVGLFVDVPGVTLMPLLPLVAWVSIGVLAGRMMLVSRDLSGDTSRAGAPRRTLYALAACGLLAWGLGSLATGAMVDALSAEYGDVISRRHPAVWFNVIDLGGRGVLVLALSALAANHVTGRLRKALLTMGRGSLVAYVFHIPFCYGSLGEPLRGQLDMATATLWVAALIAVSWGAVWLRDEVRVRVADR